MHLRLAVPSQGRRIGRDPVTSSAIAVRQINTPADLQAVMKTDFAPSAQQWQAITAPLSPAVVIAGDRLRNIGCAPTTGRCRCRHLWHQNDRQLR